jgi:hypothetical protein
MQDMVPGERVKVDVGEDEVALPATHSMEFAGKALSFMESES